MVFFTISNYFIRDITKQKHIIKLIVNYTELNLYFLTITIIIYPSLLLRKSNRINFKFIDIDAHINACICC